MAGFLRKAGDNVLVPGFYLWKGLSQNLAGIPNEYAEKAAKWLEDGQGIEKIAMTGAGLLFHAIRCIIERNYSE